MSSRYVNLYQAKPTKEHKLNCVKLFRTENCTIKEFCGRHKLRQSTFREWLGKVSLLESRKIDLMQTKEGRPRAVDDEEMANLKSKIIAAVRSQRALSRNELKQAIDEAHNATLLKRGIAAIAPKLSKNTYMTIMKKLNAQEEICQLKTSARIEAESDPRNMLSMIAMQQGICSDLNDAEFILNFDATQYVISTDPETKAMTIKGEAEVEKVALTREGSGELASAVKMFHLHNAAGCVSPPVFVIADASLKDEEFDYFKVRGLSLTSSYGYLVFSKTRCCSRSFFTWYLKEVVCPFICSIRAGCAEIVSFINNYKKKYEQLIIFLFRILLI